MISKKALQRLLVVIGVDNDGDLKYCSIAEMMEHLKLDEPDVDIKDVREIMSILMEVL